MNYLAFHNQHIAPLPIVIENIYLDDEGRDNIIGLTSTVSGGVSPYTYLWEDLETDTLFVTGTGGTLPATSTSGDSNSSTEEIGWHSTVTTSTGGPYDVRLTVTDAVGQTVQITCTVVDTSPNHIEVSLTGSTVTYAGQTTHNLPTGNYTYSWTLPSSGTLSSGSLTGNTVTIDWDGEVWLDDVIENVTCTMTADPANPQAVYSEYTIPVTVTGVITGSATIAHAYYLDNATYVTESSGNVSAVTDVYGSSNLTATNTPTWDGSKVSFPGTAYLHNTTGYSVPSDPVQIAVIGVLDITNGVGGFKSLGGLTPSITSSTPKQLIEFSGSEQIYWALNSNTTSRFVVSGSTTEDLQVVAAYLDVPDNSHTTIASDGTTATDTTNFSAQSFSNLNGIVIGSAFASAGSDIMNGDVYKMFIINGDLSSTERDDIMDRLKTHYSII